MPADAPPLSTTMHTLPFPLEPAPAALDRVRGADVRALYVGALMIAAVSHQLWLCLLFTQAGIGGKSVVMFAEILLLSAALPLLLQRLPLGFYLAIALLLCNAIALALVRDSLDPKPLRDLLVPIVFLGVGLCVGGEAQTDRLVRRVVWVVLAVAAFEFLALEQFSRIFDIQSFYLARGVGDPQMGLYRSDKLVASAIRPEGIGRTLLPFLGPHRVSSVFAEPVSLGNFAVILAAWGLAKERARWREGAFFLAVAATLLVLSDSRFGTLAVGLLVVLRLVLVRGAEPMLAALPVLAALGLIGLSLATGGVYSDSIVGRLTLTGTTLMAMDAGDVFGLVKPAHGFFDMGYPYILANFGLTACVLLWTAFWLLPRQSGPARRFHAYVALYLVLILCVSGTSAFAFKTSALLWFLLGTLLDGRAGSGAHR